MGLRTQASVGFCSSINRQLGISLVFMDMFLFYTMALTVINNKLAEEFMAILHWKNLCCLVTPALKLNSDT